MLYYYILYLLTIYLFVPVRTFILASLNCVTGELRAYREGAQVDLSVSKLVPEIYYSRLILNEVTHPLHRKQTGICSSSPPVVLSASLLWTELWAELWRRDPRVFPSAERISPVTRTTARELPKHILTTRYNTKSTNESSFYF